MAARVGLFHGVRAALAAMGAVGALAMPAGATPPTRVVAAAGLPGYGMPGLADSAFSAIGAAQIDEAGDVISTCRFAGPGVVYSSNDLGLFAFDRYGRGQMLGRTGVSSGVGAPLGLGVGDAAFGASFFPRLRVDGRIAAVCFLNGTGIDPTNNTGYWTGDTGSILPTIRSGTGGVPGVPGASFYGFITGFPCVANRSGIAFTAQMGVGPGGVTIDTYRGLWGPALDGSGRLALVARTGVPEGSGDGAPPVAGAWYTALNSRSLVLAANGRLAFAGTLAGPGIVPANDTALIDRGADGVPRVAAREGDAVPGHPGLVFASLDTSAYVTSGGTSINSGGDLAFGDIDAADLPASGVSRLWVRRAGGEFQLLAARNVHFGDGAPAGVAGVFTTIQAPAMSSSGTVAFAGTVLTDVGVQVSGLWMADSSGVVRMVLQSGIAGGALSPPGLSGPVFSTQLPAQATYRINARGQLLVRWKLEDGVAGVISANNDGLWAYDPAIGLICIARTGDVNPTLPGAGTIRGINTFLGPAGDDDGRIMDLNARGEVAYCAQFSDTTGALLVSQLPGLGACCRGGTCGQEASDACVGGNARFAGLGTSCQGATPACCAADFDQSGSLSAQDIFAFLQDWFAGAQTADVDASGGLSAQDVFVYLAAWFAGCG